MAPPTSLALVPTDGLRRQAPRPLPCGAGSPPPGRAPPPPTGRSDMSFGPKLSRMKREKPFGEWTRTNERVGKGGLGEVLVAYHRDDQTRARPHALKQLRNTDRLDRVERFRREVHAALRLEHPGVVKPVASDLNVERPYLVMPLYRKGHLTRDRAARMAPVERLRDFASICRAVGHAHGQRIVHRDIGPGERPDH